MAPKKKKKKPKQKIRCDQVDGERFHIHNEDVFNFNWWEVFCFPYILCARFWDCCVSLCAGTNQCLVYWMMIQWIVCKITKITTPDPIIFPYYFYMFCQVILLTLFFILLWSWFGNTIIIPFFKTIWEILTDKVPLQHSSQNATRLSFRRYCFRKGEIFDRSIDIGVVSYPSSPVNILTVLLDIFIVDILY